MKTDEPIVFLFSGQGSQYYHMGLELYEEHDRFKYWMDTLDEKTYELTMEHILSYLYDVTRKKS